MRVQVDRRHNAESHAEPPASLIPQFRNCPLRLSHINNELAVENTRQKTVIAVSLRVNCRGVTIDVLISKELLVCAVAFHALFASFPPNNHPTKRSLDSCPMQLLLAAKILALWSFRAKRALCKTPSVCDGEALALCYAQGVNHSCHLTAN